MQSPLLSCKHCLSCYVSYHINLIRINRNSFSSIEHLNEDVLSAVPSAVFGVIRPKIAVFTTPNSEFNVKFGPNFEGPFRHWDHKVFALKIDNRHQFNV